MSPEEIAAHQYQDDCTERGCAICLARELIWETQMTLAAAAKPKLSDVAANVPPSCPRRGCGDLAAPIACALVCRYNCNTPGDRGPVGTRRRTPGDDCALAIASRGGVTLQAVADAFGTTQSSVRNIERRALLKVRAKLTISDED